MRFVCQGEGVPPDEDGPLAGKELRPVRARFEDGFMVLLRQKEDAQPPRGARASRHGKRRKTSRCGCETWSGNLGRSPR